MSSALNEYFVSLLYMTTLQERIFQILEEMEPPERGKQSRLARIAGVSRGLVNQWLNGTIDSIGYDYAKNIADQLGYRLEWVLKGEQPRRPQVVSGTFGAGKTKAAVELATAASGLVADKASGKVEGSVVLKQYRDVGGSMGNGLVLRDQPGEIQAWSVTEEWVRKNIKNYTSIQNLCIVTGFGPSMQPMFNPGDPLVVDRGVRTVEYDAVYFFRVGNEGFIKILQRIPTANGLVLRAKSKNPDYDPFDIMAGMDFEVFGQVLKAWNGLDL